MLKPGQKLFWEFTNQSDGRLFYYDAEKQVSQWEKPQSKSEDEVQIVNAQKYQE